MHLSLLQIATLASAAPLAPADLPVAETAVVAPVPEAPASDPEAATQPPPADKTEGYEPESDVIVVTGEYKPPPGDPLEQLNATTFEITKTVDQVFVEPVADVYEAAVPDPLRGALRNFLQNLLEPVNFVNGMLQLKPDLAFEALGRFAINSTLGIGGVMDVAAKPGFDMEFRRNGFANTMAYYGVGEGAFLVLPLVGATTVRDFVGSALDQSLVPFLVGPPLNTPYYGIPAYTVNSLEFRNRFEGRIAQIYASDDPYAAMRASYLCEREADIADLRGLPHPDCRIEVLMADPPEEAE